jgi:23S rRNA pseudouridine1911/1915/1917 synthase
VFMEEEIKDLPDQSELYEHYRYVVDPGQRLLRIDKYLSSRIENASRTRIQTAASAGNILVNEQVVKSNYRVKPLDLITIVMAYPPREQEIIPEDIPLNIVYEDDDVIVVNKEAGMVVHPGHGNYTGTLINALAYRLKDLPLYQAGELRPGLVHRLDKDTSGILVVAKTEFSLNRLAKQFFDRTTSRKYLALVWGNLKEEQGTIIGNIGRDPRDRMKMTVFPEGEEGKHAITHYKLIERFSYVNLVECTLETGRTHQIRAHFEYIGHPLFNDDRYGGDKIIKGTTFTRYKQFVQNCFKVCPRHALHAKSLGFTHPVTGKELFFESDLPADMQALNEKWRRYVAGRDADEDFIQETT